LPDEKSPLAPEAVETKAAETERLCDDFAARARGTVVWTASALKAWKKIVRQQPKKPT
jgi:hypothetical protein